MMKIPKTQRGREKALEKELPWSLIPQEQHQGFKEAARKQWDEHVQHDALLPLTVEESRKVLRTKADRVLNSRFAYRDKLWSRRRQDSSVGWKPKARLVIAGHKDPDLMDGLPTHAPTISRQGILLLLQILASNLNNAWGGYAGDVTAAFLCEGSCTCVSLAQGLETFTQNNSFGSRSLSLGLLILLQLGGQSSGGLCVHLSWSMTTRGGE